MESSVRQSEYFYEYFKFLVEAISIFNFFYGQILVVSKKEYPLIQR